MKPSGIGGQAVMEGVMMRNKSKYAVAVRKPDRNIIINVKEWKSITEKVPFLGWPLIRGSVSLIESMIVGMQTLTYSANFFDVEEGSGKENAGSEPVARSAESAGSEPAAKSTGKQSEAKDKTEGALGAGMMIGTVCLSLLLTCLLFVFLPLVISDFVVSLTGIPANGFWSSLLEGVVRISIFILYVVLISFMNDIKRVFMYHGAEHKTINCIEHGLPLTVENARNSSKEHKRCGTSFMIIVMVISILLLSVVNLLPIYTGDVAAIRILVRLGVRLVLLPVVAGVSYEFLKLAGRTENKLVNLLSRPGMWMQALTTKEPTDEMLEVAIASVEAVFDWEAFLQGGTGEKEVALGEQELVKDDISAEV